MSKEKKYNGPTKKGYRKFQENYSGMMEADRAYMLAATGDRRYAYRRDIWPGFSVNDLPERKRDAIEGVHY